MTSPKVSVLIPCFRAAPFLRTALHSVLAQTFVDWEVVLVDNASDDGTFAVAEEYARRDPRIRIFRNEENLGPVRNWRRTAELARGELASLLFADDWYEPEFLAEAVALLAGDAGMGFVYSAVRMVRAAGTPGGAGEQVSYQLDEPGPHPSTQFLRGTYERSDWGLPVSPGCALMRRRDLARWLSRSFANEGALGYMKHGAGPDVAVYVQACLDYPRFGHLVEPRVNFLAHATNLSWRKDVALAYPLALRELYDDAPERFSLDEQRVRAVLAVRLRSSAYRWESLRKLGLRGWAALGGLAGAALARRVWRVLWRTEA